MNAKGLEALLARIRACRECDLPLGPRPVLRAETSARLMIVGQAPGTRVHETGIPWNDASGDRLRDWLGLDKEEFYDGSRIAILPMGFCYPGRLPRGGDAPPRPECAAWHGELQGMLPNIGLTLLVGSYAQAYYLGRAREKTMAGTVAKWRGFLPIYLPMPHPSWRTIAWVRKNPWFETDLVPVLKERVRAVLA